VPAGEITVILERIQRGEEQAADRLLPLVYDELRRLAAARMAHEAPGVTLQPTALVHEAYLRLASEPATRWENRSHFMAVAARAMRRILVDHARKHRAAKRGSGAARLTIDHLDRPAVGPDDVVDLVTLDDALSRLASIDPRQARIVELRFFGGLSVDDTAAILSASTRTVKRDWQLARAWLKREMARLDMA
jgi:RNA polymerase sigma factor (TIGR02999 family)